MKKLAVLLFLSITLFCSCSSEHLESNSRIVESSLSSSVSRLPSKPIDDSSFEDKIYDGSAFIDDPTVKYLGMAGDFDVYKKAVEIGEMRLDIVYGKDGVFNSITKVPATEYWIIDSEGNLLIDHPFYDLNFWAGEDFYSIELYQTSGIEGCYQGNYYVYSFLDEKFELVEFYEAGEYEMNEYTQSLTPSGYKRTRYTYGVGDTYTGLNDNSGNIIFEPIYSYISIPFENRFIVNTNNVDKMDGWEGFSVLMDIDKNILCVYTAIDFYHFYDGSYIGIARYVGGNDKTGHILHNENGELIELGYRFIDKDGNELSTCLGTEYLVYSIDDYVENYLDEFLTDFDGKPLEITGRDFICEP